MAQTPENNAENNIKNSFGAQSGSGARVFGLAGRYATALFEQAHAETGQLAHVVQDMNILEKALEESQDFKRLIQSPLLSRAQAQAAVAALAKTLGLNVLTQRFMGVLAANRRLAALPDVVRNFKTLYDAHNGIVNATVRSAQSLTEAQQQAILDKLTRQLHAQVQLTTQVDPALLGGLVVQIGSKLIDNSLKTKLDRVSLAMKG